MRDKIIYNFKTGFTGFTCKTNKKLNLKNPVNLVLNSMLILLILSE
jgi:hypothetical protein